MIKKRYGRWPLRLAAAQCGKATPYRRVEDWKPKGYASGDSRGAASNKSPTRTGKAEPYRTVAAAKPLKLHKL